MYIVYVMDRAALEAELRRLQEECDTLRRLAHARAVEAAILDRLKDEFIATASHDLKSPLTSILGYAQLMLRTLGTAEPDLGRVANAAEVIRDQTVAMTRLLDDLLDASRIQAGVLVLRPAPCELGSCLATVLARLGPEERARVDVVLANAPLAGEWDPKRVDQVLANLLGNALKYSPDSARVDITVDRGADAVAVAISDRGLGIPAAELPRLFQRFYRTPQAHASGLPGTGLGLYVSAGIIAAHGGRLWAESPGEGQGATFRFTLPDRPPTGPQRPLPNTEHR